VAVRWCRSRTIYPQPVKDGLHSIQSGIGKGVNMVGDAACELEC